MDGIHESWLTNRVEHADTPDTFTQSLYCCLGDVLNTTYNLKIQKVILPSNQHWFRVHIEFKSGTPGNKIGIVRLCGSVSVLNSIR